MSKYFVQNTQLRSIALALYRAYAHSLFWRKGPRVFVNSLPKAGTHLVTGILEEFPLMMNSRMHVDPWDIHLGIGEHLPLKSFYPDLKTFRQILDRVRGGQIITGHLPWRSPLLSTLLDMEFRVIYVTRNARDVLNSRLHYIMGLERHHLHRRLISEYDDDQERLLALVKGFDRSNIGPGTDAFDDYLSEFHAWESIEKFPGCCVVEFENVVGMSGGGRDEDRYFSIFKMGSILGDTPSDDLIAKILESTQHKKSVTYRSGKIGEGQSLDILRDEL